jgi:hypothetical protein
MKEKAKVAGTTGGAIGMGVFAAALGTCCVAPWAVSLLGVTGAVGLVRLSFLKPYVLAGAVVLVALSFWFAYRPLPVCSDGSCETTGRRGLRIMAWFAAVAVVALIVASFPGSVLGGAPP